MGRGRGGGLVVVEDVVEEKEGEEGEVDDSR